YTSPEVIELPTGAYEIEDINKELQEKLGKENIKLQANNNLLKVGITSKYYINFTQDNSIGSMLGFPKSSGVLDPGKTHTGSSNVDIIKISTINVNCNIIHGAYHNGANKHILHSFYPTVAPGFRIVEKPHNLVYLPLNTSYISDVVVNVLDQDGDVVNFRNETISVRIHIKPVV
ncbi:hypothetical protein, partial [Klebsiella pneumoniae]|uniref:hypothetical protein n=1 Tax=Klebsiella pneumoniae TaxID=573 RepID=UPI00163D6EF2